MFLIYKLLRSEVAITFYFEMSGLFLYDKTLVRHQAKAHFHNHLSSNNAFLCLFVIERKVLFGKSPKEGWPVQILSTKVECCPLMQKTYAGGDWMGQNMKRIERIKKERGRNKGHKEREELTDCA